MQRNSPQRADMLSMRRVRQLLRNKAGAKFTPVYRSGIKWRRKLGPKVSLFFLTDGRRMHPTKGERKPTEYERTVEHG